MHFDPEEIEAETASKASVKWITEWKADETDYPIAKGHDAWMVWVISEPVYIAILSESDMNLEDMNWLEVSKSSKSGTWFELIGELIPSYSATVARRNA